MAHISPLLAAAAVFAAGACGPNSPSAQMLPAEPGEPPTQHQPSGDPDAPVLVADAMAAIYGQENHRKGWLGCTVQGDRVWLSHGSTNSQPGTALVAATDRGELVAVNRSGALAPLSSLSADQQWRAAAEGLILAATPRQLWVLNYDNNSGGTRGEMFRWVEGAGAPVVVRGATANHKRAMTAVADADGNATLVAANSPTYDWPSMEVVRQPSAAAPTAEGLAGPETVGAQAVPVVYNSRVYVFSPTIPRGREIPTHPAAGRLSSDGRMADVIAPTEADLWPDGAGEVQTWPGFPHRYWPQVRDGIETAEGLFLVARVSGLWFLSDDGAGGLSLPAQLIETVPGRAYAGFRGRVLALDADGSLWLRSGDSWTALTTLPDPPGATSFLCVTTTGAVVATGARGSVEGASAPMWLAIWKPFGALTGL